MTTRRLWLIALASGLVAACAQPPRVAPHTEDAWSGRLALLVEDTSAQSFSAGFELQGSAERGELALFNPLGNVIARVRWQPGSATLDDGKQVRRSASITALTEAIAGSALPIAALFAWLHGNEAEASGWYADLSSLPAGRITATRLAPLPRAVLRVVFDR